jgi:hypothetical protein
MPSPGCCCCRCSPFASALTLCCRSLIFFRTFPLSRSLGSCMNTTVSNGSRALRKKGTERENYLHEKKFQVYKRERRVSAQLQERNYFEMEYHFIIVYLFAVAEDTGNGSSFCVLLFVRLCSLSGFSTVPLPDAAAEFTSWFLNFSTRD